MFFVIKILISAVLIAVVSWLAGEKTVLAGAYFLHTWLFKSG